MKTDQENINELLDLEEKLATLILGKEETWKKLKEINKKSQISAGR